MKNKASHRIYVWTHKELGLMYNTSKKNPRGNIGKFMGWTYDIDFPKKMNTGRILHEATSHHKTTVTTLTGSIDTPLCVPKGVVTAVGKSLSVDAAKLPRVMSQPRAKHQIALGSSCRIGQPERCYLTGCEFQKVMKSKPCNKLCP